MHQTDKRLAEQSNIRDPHKGCVGGACHHSRIIKIGTVEVVSAVEMNDKHREDQTVRDECYNKECDCL